MRIPDPVAALFPPTCILCGAPGVRGLDLCAGCDRDLPRNRPCCPSCALPLDAPLPPAARCGNCSRRAPAYERCVAALRYEDPVPHLATAAKFRGRLNAARLLGMLLAETIGETLVARGAPWPEILIPVPLHPRRLAERGYNQALEIARPLARRLGVPIDTRCCRRVLATQPQTGLDESARRRNLRGAFAADSPLPWGRVAIVDDVVTTGNTVAELTRVLRSAGAEHVEVWAAARTP